ncbi:MAG: GNAT family N-acetyltransferase, partial [Porphyromonadaceae bacterium]|nr:GNAT family N-acetyltransferase [Porphyromonadaceae bacterium]
MYTTPIITPIDKALIRAELTPDKLLRQTNKGGNELYVFHALSAPHTMREIGRLREEAFRYYGGGTGKDCDIDSFDLDPEGYRQLIVWDPAEEAILGGYRFVFGDEVGYDAATGKPRLATAEMFDFSPRFLSDYLPYTIELGRSFVSLPYQSTRMGAKSLFALDNLWDGLGALTVLNPEMRYFYGKVTMYKDYDRHVRNLILYFLSQHF